MSEPTSLFLAPHDPQATPTLETLQQVLSGLEIIGAPLAHMTFAAGEGFSRHVIYAGCAPHLVMTPPADGSRRFCHVALHGPFQQPRLVTGPNTVKPRCPDCRARYSDWRDQLTAWRAGTRLAQCPACGRMSAPGELDWRNHAIVARVLIELRNVFPGEASPSDQLLDRLTSATGLEWQHAWAAYLEVETPPA